MFSQDQAEAIALAREVLAHWQIESFNEIVLHGENKDIPKDYELVQRKLKAAALKFKLLKGAPK
jgi:hypothetical protein